MKARTQQHDGVNVSRRSFFKLSVGSISLLPTVASALALAPQTALAEDKEPRAGLAAASTIYVVSPKELGLVVRDVSIEDGTANLIQGAHVTIKSRFNGKVLDGYTDNKGAVHFDIADLAEDEGKMATIPRYAFNATIEVTAQGYRDFKANLIRVNGGTALGIPTQPRQAGLPYPVCTSFDQWDVLYSEGDDSTFVSATGNDVKHTVELTINDCPAGASVIAGLFVDGQRVTKTTVTANSDGQAQAKLSDEFLRAGGAAALPTGEDHEYSMRFIVNNTTYEVPIKLSVVAAAPEAQNAQVKEDLKVVPFNDRSMFVGVSVPEKWPVIGGKTFKLWEPEFFFNCAYDPFGFIMIKFSTPEWGYKYDNGKPDTNGWKTQTRKWPNEAYKDFFNNAIENKNAAYDALYKGKNFFTQAQFAHKFTFTVQAEILAAATWDFEGGVSQGRAQASARLAANYSFCETFWAGWIPIMIRFSLNGYAAAIFEVGYVSPSVWKFSEYRWDYNSTGFELQGRAGPTLSLGIGINGLASASLRGTFAFTWFLHIGPLPEGYKDLPSPHMRTAFNASAWVDVEILWFTESKCLWKVDEPNWKDNWEGRIKSTKLREGEALTGVQEGKTLKDTAGSASIITAGSLKELAEFKTSGLKGMNPQEKKLLGYTLFERTADGDVPVSQVYLAQESANMLASEAGVKMEAADPRANDADVKLESASDNDGVAAVQTNAPAAQPESGVQKDSNQVIELDGEHESQASTAAGAAVGAIAAAGAASDGIELVGNDSTNAPQADAVASAGADTLTAQDDNSEPTYILRPTNDEIVAYETNATDGEPIGEHNYKEIGDETPGILKLGAEQGCRPTIDYNVASNILLPQRQKFFTVGEFDYIARIGSVIVAGEVRTRIICQQVNGKDRRVLDFVSHYGRDNCFDYDFDIDVARVDGHDVVDMVVISGERPQGDATSMAQAATTTYFNFVSCTDWYEGTFSGMTIIAKAMDTIGDRCQSYPYRNYSCPRIVHIKETKDGKEYCKAVVSYLERAADREGEIMGTDPDFTRAGVGVVFYSAGDDCLNVDSLDVMRPFNSGLADPSITEITLSGRADGYQMLEIKGAQGTHYALLETDPCWYIWKDGSSLARLHSARRVNLGEYDEKITRLISMEKGTYFLTCIDGMLKRVDVQPGSDTEAPKLIYSDFGGEELNMDDFGILENGDLLYWPAVRENGGYVFDADDLGDPTLNEGEGGELNLIMAARVRNGKLSKAFALAEVGHGMTGIRTFGNSDDHMSFISSNTIDLAAGKGEQWYTVVPWVRCANLLEADPYSTLVARGDQLPFYVTLRNDGNCYLSGVELTVAEVGGSAIGTIRLDFAEDNIVPSEWNKLNDDGTLDGVEDDWMLAPGTTSRYLAKSVTIPENWEGEKEIEIFVTAAYGSTVRLKDSLLAQSEQHSIEFLPDQRVKAGLKLNSSELTIEEDGSYGPSDVTIIKGAGKSSNGSKSNGSKKGSSKGGSKGNSSKSGSGSKGSSGARGAAAKSGSGAKANSGTTSGSGTNGSSTNGSSTNGSTASTGNKASANTGDATDAYKQGSMPRTGDPTNLTAAAAVAIGGAASIAAAKALHDKGEANEEASDE